MKFIYFILYAYATYTQTIILNAHGTHQTMYNDSTYNDKFILNDQLLNCDCSQLYKYVQTHQQFTENSGYTISLKNVTNQVNLSVGSKYGWMVPTINASTCLGDCVIQVRNNCPAPSYFKYFDVVELAVGGLHTLSYNVFCDETVHYSQFEGGLAVQAVSSIIVIGLAALFSSAASIGNFGISITVPFVMVVDVFIVVFGALIFSGIIIEPIGIALTVASWAYGILSIWLCTVEVLYLGGWKWLGIHKKIYKRVKFRVMDLIGILVGVGITCIWWFLGETWIVGDIILIAMWVCTIKIFKFTSLCMSFFTFCFTIIIELIFLIVVEAILHLSYNIEVINLFNNPFFFQVPTINPVPNLKCSWLFISSLVYPGMVLSYLHRFDRCRSSYVYYTIFLVGYFTGSMIWVIISAVSTFTLPFGIVSEPIILLIVILYANRRNQLPILWNGKFLDEDYKDNQRKVAQLVQIVKTERSHSKMTFGQSLLRGLRLKTDLISPINEQ